MNKTFVLAFAFAGLACPADEVTVRAALQPPSQRKPAPDFALQDAVGKRAALKNYRGKVLLLDFWATWCHGCKEEIPWFSQFQKSYGPKGFAVLGVAMDDEGWKIVKPFLADAKIPYRMVLGGDSAAQRYGAKDALPDTFLIDRQGRVAAIYRGLVDRADLEANIRAVLMER